MGPRSLDHGHRIYTSFLCSHPERSALRAQSRDLLPLAEAWFIERLNFEHPWQEIPRGACPERAASEARGGAEWGSLRSE
jgi:hypothetical protein